MVEHFGGKLGVLSYPMHGKPSEVVVDRNADTKGIFDSLPVNALFLKTVYPTQGAPLTNPIAMRRTRSQLHGIIRCTR